MHTHILVDQSIYSHLHAHHLTILFISSICFAVRFCCCFWLLSICLRFSKSSSSTCRKVKSMSPRHSLSLHTFSLEAPTATRAQSFSSSSKKEGKAVEKSTLRTEKLRHMCTTIISKMQCKLWMMKYEGY